MKKVKMPKVSAQICLFAALLIATIAALLFRLVSLLPGVSAAEIPLSSTAGSLQTLLNNPIQFPLEATRALIFALTHETGIGFMRLPSVLFGLVMIVVAYWLLRKWYGYRLAIFGSLLLLTAPWFLHIARLSTNDIMYPLAMFGLLALAALWHQATRPSRLIYLSVFAVAVMLYIPGFVWLVVVPVFIERKNIIATLKSHRWHATLAALFGLVLAAPLIYAVISNWRLLKQIAGLPVSGFNPLDFLQGVGITIRNVFFGGMNQPVMNLAGLPLIDILTTITFVVGVYLYSKHWRAPRTQLLLWLFILSVLLTALNPALISYAVILPIIVVLSTGGLGYLLHLWLRVFPKNPYARAFGISLMGVVVLFAVGYNLRNYYIAWPNNPETRAAFQQQP